MVAGNEILTCAEMRALEQRAIASGAVTGLELMERAGAAVVAAVLGHWPAMAQTAQRAVVLCGPGNNGGDGYVVARRLHQRGWQVAVFAWGDPAALPPDARANHDRWAALGAVQAWDHDAILAAPADLYVDAVFGTGLTRPPPEAVTGTFSALYTSARSCDRLVAIDAPTGLDLDRGADLCPVWGAVYAWLTVTFHSPKPGHFIGEGPAFCGALRVVDIGLSSWSQISPAERPTAADGASGGDICAKKLRRAAPDLVGLAKHVGHKYNHGHALVLAGGAGRGGAARLAARAALRVGAGLVTLACPQEALTENAARLDAVMLRAVERADALGALLADPRIGALALGPGLGLERARDLVPVALAAGRAAVLDADALTAFAAAPQALFDHLHRACVLTPHAGEFARLFPDLDLTDPLTAVRAAAARADCTVLLKGAATLIAAPDGAARVNAAVYADAAPWLATAGSGDVLAGIIAGLLARGLPPLDAAATGAWLHAACARRFGPGLIAEDLPDQLPGVLRDLGL